jgi:hypothetical protein
MGIQIKDNITMAGAGQVSMINSGSISADAGKTVTTDKLNLDTSSGAGSSVTLNEANVVNTIAGTGGNWWHVLIQIRGCVDGGNR